MKKHIIKYIGIFAFVIGVSSIYAQTPPPPNNNDTGNGGDTPVGGGAPLGSGIAILIAIGSAYGYTSLKRKDKE